MQLTFDKPQVRSQSIGLFVKITFLTSIWVQLSETFRYFIVVIPATKNPEVIPMNGTVFGIWIIWGTILTGLTVFMYWLYAQRFGNNLRSVLVSGTLSWLFFFLLFWLGLANMGLTQWSTLPKVLPLAWLELVIASLISHFLYGKIG